MTDALPLLTDTHCHLDAGEFDADRDEVIRRARALGVATLVVPAVDRASLASAAALSDTHPGCHAAFGLHPLYVARHTDADLAAVRHMLETRPAVAVGEIGLDLYVPGLDPARQLYFFTAQLKLARDFDLPVILHARRANDPVMKQLRRFGVRRGIAHAFSGSRVQAEAFIRQGLKLGFGGATTWSRANRLRELAATLPLEAIVLETDAPDIPPRFIGQARNSPEFLPAIAAEIAGLRGLSVAELAAATSANARAALALPPGVPASGKSDGAAPGDGR